VANAQVVGWNLTTLNPLLWERDGSTGQWNDVVDLDVAVCDCPDDWDLREAHDVNDSGWIVGWGGHNGQVRAFLLRPVDQCPADLDGDGDVDNQDLTLLLAHWTGNNFCSNCDDLCCSCLGDINLDCKVGIQDLTPLLGAFGFCPGFGKCADSSASAGFSLSLTQAVQVLGFESVASYQVWLAGARDEEAFVSAQVLVALLE
jgi:hypothetical protein